MNSCHRRSMRVLGAALGAVLALGLAGCGGGSTAADPTLSPSVAATSAVPSPSATPTKKAKPLSRFENRPQVKVLRKWAVAYAKDINHHRYSLTSAQRYESTSGKTNLPQIVQDDRGMYYPGPLPFTPVAVSTSGGHSFVTMCGWEHGFTVKPRSHRTVSKKVVGPAQFVMTKVNGSWRVDALQAATADCSGVKVVGVKW